MPEPLSTHEIRHTARLARLSLTDEQVEEYRVQLSSILDHIAILERLDVEGVEPMAHPLDIVNRLADDEVGPTLATADVLRLAPSTEGPFIAVPKVLDEGGA